MLSRWLPFEEPLVELEGQIDALKEHAAKEKIDLSAKIDGLEARKRKLMADIFSNLSPWDKVQLARHPKRPYTLDFVERLCSDWVELHGDRAYGDDGAMIAGLARFRGRGVAVIGNQKGRDTKERLARNHGMVSPEGYRKAGRVMQLAARFRRPILSFVDTPGAACSPEAEERGISEAIAASILQMSALPVPIIVVITGEGCSGGAIATAYGDRVLMLEHAYYSVIAPESGASIIYRDSAKAAQMAENLKITAQDAEKFGIIEEIVPEPLGGAHRDMVLLSQTLGDTIERFLGELSTLTTKDLLNQRYTRFRKLGEFSEPPIVDGKEAPSSSQNPEQ